MERYICNPRISVGHKFPVGALVVTADTGDGPYVVTRHLRRVNHRVFVYQITHGGEYFEYTEDELDWFPSRPNHVPWDQEVI